MKKNRQFFCVLWLIAGLVFVSGCQSKEKKTENKPANFYSLMGEGLPCWQYVQTKEDWDNISFFQQLYQKNTSVETLLPPQLQVPKKIHFIWVGPKEFPAESIGNVKSWIAKHPQWEFIFWTDRVRALPHPQMKMKLIQDFLFTKLEKYFYSSENYGEKSDVLRYEILWQEGGVYVDHDVKCFKAFDPLNSSYEFYCALQLPSQIPLSSSIQVTNNLIASVPKHPIIKKTIDWLSDNWDEIEKLYPGKDKEAVIARVWHRTFSAFANAVRALASSEQKEAVFPAYYFNAPDDEHALYARHTFAGAWFDAESIFEKNTRQRLMKLSKKVNVILLVSSVLGIANLLGVGFFLYFFYKRKRTMG